MRTYILALTKYFITIIMLLYTGISLIELRSIGRAKKFRMNFYLVLLMFLVNAFSFLTITVGARNMYYILFWILETIGFAAALLIYRRLYPNSNMTLYIHEIMMLSVGLIIIARLDFSKAIKQFIIAMIGLIFTIAVPYFMKRFRFMKKLTYIYALIGIVALLAVLLIGNLVNGSNLSFTIGGITLQPSEFIKIIFVLFLASAYYETAEINDVMRAGIIAAVQVLILMVSKDLGSGLIYYMVFIFMTYLASGKWKYLALGFGAGAIGAVLCVKLFSHVKTRVIAWIDPWSVIDGMGYQITQSLFAISGGGVFGLGLTNGTPDNIPFVESDFIFAAICEELGLIFAMCVMSLCLIIFLHILWIAINFSDRFYRLTAFGFAIVYIFQTFLTIGGEVRFIPLTGVTLPLVSYGGSSVLSTVIMFSMIQAIFIMQQDRLAKFKRRYVAEERRRKRAYADSGARAGRYEELPMRKRTDGIRENGQKRRAGNKAADRYWPGRGVQHDDHLLPARRDSRENDEYLDDGMTENLSGMKLADGDIPERRGRSNINRNYERRK